MLSTSFDISEFINKVKGRSDQEIIYMADQEATAAERLSFKCKVPEDRDSVQNYAMLLKDVVLYVRHGIMTHSTRQLNLERVGNAERYH